ncbi:hypothetical protein WA026_008239 [Henosepilachna vigintioctopunctata]|uniref:Uncharacterized protein n=1 Tax=Henosepilachna vigintioctopunctata TaxID=420089 RepID=A0AAW1TQJ8_9CUCU
MEINYDVAVKRKIVEDRKAEVSPLKKKKFIDADTQTVDDFPLETMSVSTESNENTQEQKEAVDEQTQSTIVVEESPSPPKQVVKIFDDKRLEIIRKNRLRFFLSAMTGQEIPSIPIEDRRKALDQDWRPKKR